MTQCYVLSQKASNDQSITADTFIKVEERQNVFFKLQYILC